MAVILRILLIVVAVYLVLALFFFIRQDRLVYFPVKTFNSFPSEVGLPYREVTFTAADGVKLYGWLVGSDEYNEVVLFCHGNAGNISHRLETLAIFNHMGLRTFIFDYRGYGRSEGHPSEKGTYMDVEAAWQFLTETEKIPAGQIILFGRSLGGAIAAHLAAGNGAKARALVLESTFTSVPDLGAELYPMLPVRFFCRIKYNTRALLPKITMPVLIVHSPDDELIPFNHGQALFKAANQPKQFLQISGGHNDGFLRSGKKYIDGLSGFLFAGAPASSK